MKKIIMHSRINMDISPGAGRGLAYFIEHELLPRKESQIKTSSQPALGGRGGFSEFQIGRNESFFSSLPPLHLNNSNIL